MHFALGIKNHWLLKLFLLPLFKNKNMSGVYLIVWDENTKEKSDLLKTTKGGYPHITVAYIGKLVAKQVLLEISSALFFKVGFAKSSVCESYSE